MISPRAVAVAAIIAAGPRLARTGPLVDLAGSRVSLALALAVILAGAALAAFALWLCCAVVRPGRWSVVSMALPADRPVRAAPCARCSGQG